MMLLLVLACIAPSDHRAETGVVDTSTPSESASDWTIRPLDDADGGLQLRLVADPNGVWAAWFANTPTSDGICDEIANAPPPRQRFALRAARVDDDGIAVHDVAAPVAAVQPTGLDLALDGASPVIAFTGGEPEGQFCGAHDAVLATFDGAGWPVRTVATDSADSASGDPASDAGFVVGQWPALAFDAVGRPAVLHRDVHFGTLQRDDRFRADAELAWADVAGWQHQVVDLGDGGGAMGQLAFDPRGRPVAAYVIPVEKADSRLGVWVARLEDDGWHPVHLHAGETRDQLGLVVDEHGITVAFTDTEARSARVRQLPADGMLTNEAAWSNERVGRGPYDEGRHVSVAHDPDGNIVVAYHVCQRLSDTGTSCNLNDEAVAVAVRGATGWTTEVVRAAEGSSCGRYTSLAFDPEGRMWLGFRCSVPVDGGFAHRPFVAWRGP